MIFKGLSSQVPSASELGEEVGKLRIAASGRAPSHVNDLRALARKVLGKQFKTDIDDPRWYRQQSSGLYVAFPFIHCASILLLAEPRPTLAGNTHSYHDDWRRSDEAQ